MTFWTAIPISRKLPAIIAALCVSASVSIAVVGYLDFKRNIVEQARENFQLLTQTRGDAMVTWFDNLGSNVRALGVDPTVLAALNGFDSSYNLMIDGPGLQEAYISNNPNPPGQKDRLDQAEETIPYHFQHGRFHPFFRQIKDTVGYYDIFLFNTDGDLMYSVFKEPDFATNFVTGPFAMSGLAEAYAAARNGESGQLYFADFAPYAPSAGAPASFLATPVVDASGMTIGVVAVQIPTDQIVAIVNNPIGLGETGEIYAVGADMRARSMSRFGDRHIILDDVSGISQAVVAVEHGSEFTAESIGLTGATVMAKSSHIDIFDQHWGIVGEIDSAEVTAPAILVRNKMILVTAIIAGLGVLLGWVTAQSFVKPLARLGAAMDQVSQKNYDFAFQDQDRRDEIGSLFDALIAFRDKLKASDFAEEERQNHQAQQGKVVAQLSTALTQLSDGNLTHHIKDSFPADYEELRENFNKTVDTLNETIGSVVTRASAIRQRSDNMSQSSDDLSRRTENQAATLEQTAAALDELTASVKSAADGAKEVEGVVGNARLDAQESEPVVQNAVRAMTEIESSSEEISQIIGVIDDIAFQTNLLALNAGVEAARAGEAGRGFAVVASEVRALAQRSSDAAKQIKTLISQSSVQVEKGVSLVGKAGEVLTKIAGHINHISGLVGEISAGAQEQSIGLGEINIGVTQLDKVTQQNAAMVEEATASSHALNSDAGQLADLVTRFELEDVHGGAPDVPDNIATFVPQRAAPIVSEYQGSPIRKTAGAAPRQRAVGDTEQFARNSDDIWKDF